MTYTEQTDGLRTRHGFYYTQFLSLAKARNIKAGAFFSYYDPTFGDLSDAKQDVRNNYLWVDEYSLAPSTYDKITNFISPTEQEFVTSYNTELLPVFMDNFGKKPVALSYSYGQNGFKNIVCPLYLGARNSERNGGTDYGVGYGSPSNEPYSTTRYCNKDGSMRWYDAAKADNNNFAGQLDVVSERIDETLINGGWINNFTHWHNYWEDGNEEWAETYLDLLANKNANNEIYFAGYGEAVAYLVYRQMITKVAMYSPVQNPSTQIVIRLEARNTLGIDTDLLQVPISIKFSTTGTSLAGQTIKSNCNLINLGGSNYIVEIPYSEYACAVIEKVN